MATDVSFFSSQRRKVTLAPNQRQGNDGYIFEIKVEFGFVGLWLFCLKIQSVRLFSRSVLFFVLASRSNWSWWIPSQPTFSDIMIQLKVEAFCVSLWLSVYKKRTTEIVSCFLKAFQRFENRMFHLMWTKWQLWLFTSRQYKTKNKYKTEFYGHCKWPGSQQRQQPHHD